MKTIVRIIVLVISAISAVLICTPAAFAAPPANDTFPNATAVSIGFSEVLDTTEATTDSDDAQLNAGCGAPATDASVWYAFTPATDINIVVDVSQSDYSAGVLVGVGGQGNLDILSCGPGAVSFIAQAGTTYYVLAIDDQLNGDGLNGGSLSISFNEVPSPVLDINVNRYGKVNTHTGVATISGTYTCSNGGFIDVSVEARQKVGRVATIQGQGGFSDFGTCDENPHDWSADVFPISGKFAGGKSATVTIGYSCGLLDCATGYVEKTVQLRGGK